jgi:hypothetical protein
VMCFIPAGVEHGPVYLKKVDKPIFHVAIGTGKSYIGKD